MSEEMKLIETKLRNLTFITIIGFIIVGMLLIGLYFKGETKTTITDSGSDIKNQEVTYDVSKMNKVDVKGAMALFEKKGTHVLYIGRSDCSVCVNIVPVLNEVQETLGYKTNYFDLNSTNDFRTEMKDLAAKFNIASKANGEEGTIGELFISKGYTPTIVIIKDGKAVDGFIGYKNTDSLKELVAKYI